MLIRLDRKKLLLITFFLCCVLPSYFKWFDTDAHISGWTGMDLMGSPLIAASMVFAFALLFANFKYTLTVGILAHLLLLAVCLNCFFSFPALTGLAEQRDLACSLSAARPVYWVSLALEFIHLALFTTTEIAYQQLKKRQK